MIEIGNVKKRGLMGRYKLGVSGCMPQVSDLQQTSPDVFVTPNKPKSYCIQYLFSGQVPFARYDSQLVMCEKELTTLLDMISQQRYSSLTTKHQQTKKRDNSTS